MDDKSIMETIERAKEGLPRFPEGHELEGVIDYTHAKEAPTLTAFVKYHNELLLLQRSSKMNNALKWSPVLGFLDEKVLAYKKIEEELTEELSLPLSAISNIHYGARQDYFDEAAGKTWLRHSFIVDLKEKPDITLDWEHQDYVWIKRDELENKAELLPGLLENWESAQEGYNYTWAVPITDFLRYWSEGDIF